MVRVCAAVGRRDDAAAMLATARQSLDRVGAAVHDGRLQAGLRGLRLPRAFETWPPD
jgi:hypothetical protein